MAAGAQRSELVRHRVDDGEVDDPELIREGRRADLGHDAHGQASSWYSKLKLAIQTMSPSRAPARASILGTPNRFSW